MDPERDPGGGDVIQRYGRRLFVLAYHLSGDAALALELAQECLARSLTSDDFPAGDREAGLYLHRGLLSLWKERAGLPGRGGEAPVPGSPFRERAELWRALSRLDAVSRAVFVLRVAEGLEYETIGRVLDMAPDVVYARLIQVRSVVQGGERNLDPALLETMNFYLDGRLQGEKGRAFENRLGKDRALRECVEFHRGLTLELHEDAPPLPRDFDARLRERLEQSQQVMEVLDQAAVEAGWEPPAEASQAVSVASPRRPLPPWAAVAGGAVLLLAIGMALGLWAARRPAATRQPADSATSAPTPDKETVEALRSLGYLAPGKPAATPKPSRKKPPAAQRRKPPAPIESPSVTPAPTPSPTPLPTPSPTPMQVRSSAVTWRAVTTPRPAVAGADFEVVRTAEAWSALYDGSGTQGPEVAFDQEMAILLGRGLVVVAVNRTSDALMVECRRGPEGAGQAGQAVIVSSVDLPIRIVLREAD